MLHTSIGTGTSAAPTDDSLADAALEEARAAEGDGLAAAADAAGRSSRHVARSVLMF
jgi:hypothetical protein